jgi:tetratricopeptide (TPR) repeat protein
MTRTCLITILGIAFATGAQSHDHAGTVAAEKPAVLLPGMGSYHHPIDTSRQEAQRFFDQGLVLYYGLNPDEAIRSFERAADLDPASPMPWWGISLSLGRNYNRPEQVSLQRAAYQALQTALDLAKGAPENERDYVTALAARYSDDPNADYGTLAVAYKNAMGDLMRRYPDDLDVATLYAEAAMNLRPWRLWSRDSTPAEGTTELITVLESVLARDPLHPGANHYYIHALEASPHPERALPSAARMGYLVPGAGHLVHMAAHVYDRVGDYDASAKANEQAAAADRAYLTVANDADAYRLHYYSHNLQFLVEADSMRGDYAGAQRAAALLLANGRRGAHKVQVAEHFLPTPLFVALRFQRWQDVLSAPAPESSLKLATAFWRFSRAIALACSGRAAEAEKERQEFTVASAAVSASKPYGINSARAVLALAAAVMDARIAEGKHDMSRAVDLWTKAVGAEDTLAYDEPPAWYYPVRESLGGALLRASRFADAEGIFREDLARNPRNPRSLFGLAEALAGQNKSADEAWVRAAFKTAWRHADVRLSARDL